MKESKAAKIACCSMYYFQRMFSYLAVIFLSEYIRLRRMTAAAFDLQDDRAKVSDIAAKYGYNSPTAFNRAFQSVHALCRKRSLPYSVPPSPSANFCDGR